MGYTSSYVFLLWTLKETPFSEASPDSTNGVQHGSAPFAFLGRGPPSEEIRGPQITGK